MSNDSKYLEKLPRYVFKGSANNRRSIIVIQWLTRFFAGLVLLSMVYLFIFRKTVGSSLIDYVGLFLALIGASILLHDSEFSRQKELDGCVPIVIIGDVITTSEPYHRIFNRKLSMNKNDIEYIEIVRGSGKQRVGNQEIVIWFDTTIGMKLVDKKGKKFDVGYKPPMTVKEICDLLRERWGIMIKDPGSGMGHGIMNSHGKILWDLPYDEIMKMNLFEWQK